MELCLFGSLVARMKFIKKKVMEGLEVKIDEKYKKKLLIILFSRNLDQDGLKRLASIVATGSPP